MDFSGERHIPGHGGWAMDADHRTRYLACAPHCEGKRVLDAACGSGYGTAILAQEASQVVGIDLDQEAVDYALDNHLQPNSMFLKASWSVSTKLTDITLKTL
jgi:protein-L-isoaspartate O-methyltransferase